MELRYGTPNEAGMLPERVAHARELCAHWVASGHTPTLGVCVARRGVIVLHEAFGVLGPGPDSPPLAPDALFPIMSLTKPITATLVMQLVEDGLLGLNRPVKDYLPEVCGDGTDEILVHHLLTHTTGYPFQIDLPWLEHEAKKLAAGFEAPQCSEGQDPFVHRWLSLFWDAPRVARVGEVMVYSTHNYVLLGEIVRRLSGRGLDELARERIFDPLGMHDSYYVVPESAAPRVVQRAPGIPLGPDFPGLPDNRITRKAAGCGRRRQRFLYTARHGRVRADVPQPWPLRRRAHSLSRCGGGHDPRPDSWPRRAPSQHSRGARLGWQVVSPTKWKYFDGSLQPLGTFGHPGAGGTNYGIDRDHDLVGAYFEVTSRLSPDYNLLWNFDLFQNAITAAIDD